MNLFDHTQGCAHVNGTRDATTQEALAYLEWLARMAGLPPRSGALIAAGYDGGKPIIRGATFGDASSGGYSIKMPGYGVRDVVTMDALDEAGNVIRSSVIGTTKGKIGLDAKAVRAIAGKVDKPRKARAVKTSPTEAVEGVETVAAMVERMMPPEEAVTAFAGIPDHKSDYAEPMSAPSGDVLARLARIEAALGFASRPARTERHAAAIRRAWAMRQAMRERADLDRRALLAANAAYARVEAARVAAVHRADCDQNRAIDAETRIATMQREHDAALALASEAETRANGADRAATALRRDYRALEGRADRLARIATNGRRMVSRAAQDIARATDDAKAARASERRTIAKLDSLRHAIDASPTVAKIVERTIQAVAA